MTVLSAGREIATPVSREGLDRIVQLLVGPSLAPGTLVPSGIKVIDVMCPLVAGGTVAIAGDTAARRSSCTGSLTLRRGRRATPRNKGTIGLTG
jgi:hypothetical protein